MIPRDTKEITLVATAEITIIDILDGSELNEVLKDKEKATRMVENYLKDTLNADDVHARVKFFARDIDYDN